MGYSFRYNMTDENNMIDEERDVKKGSEINEMT